MQYPLEKQLIRMYCEAVFTDRTVYMFPESALEELTPTSLIVRVSYIGAEETTETIKGQQFMVPNEVIIAGANKISTSAATRDAGEEYMKRVHNAFVNKDISFNAAGDNYSLDGAESAPHGDFFLNFGIPFPNDNEVDDQNQYVWSVTCPFTREQGF